VKTSVKVTTCLLGALMFLPGLNKLFEPAKTKFYTQLELSGLPFTDLNYWMGISGELVIGVSLVALVIFQSRLGHMMRNRIFYFCHLVVIFMMLVAVYVHLHPNVPAEYLPLAKTPYLPVAYLLIVSTNLFLNWNALGVREVKEGA